MLVLGLRCCLLATLARKDHPKIPKHMHIVTVEQEHEHMMDQHSSIWWVLQVDTEL